ncbi:MAG: hypothetical protein AB3K77_15000 [Methanosarcinaceae archaeon]
MELGAWKGEKEKLKINNRRGTGENVTKNIHPVVGNGRFNNADTCYNFVLHRRVIFSGA